MPNDSFVVAGDETGLAKVISVQRQRVIAKHGVQRRASGVQRILLGGGESGEDHLVCGLANGEIRAARSWTRLSTEKGPIGKAVLGGLTGSMTGLALTSDARSIITCNDAGHLVVTPWMDQEPGSVVSEFDVDGPISEMRHSQSGGVSCVALGGKERDLSLWNVETQQRIFTARNVPHDDLDMRVPVWISALAFLPQTSGKSSAPTGGGAGNCIVTGTGLSQIRLYDTRAQRRPLSDLDLKGTRVMSLATTCGGDHVVAADAAGTVVLIDLRGGPRVTSTYKGFGGSVRSISMHPTLPLFATGGLDRTVRVHHIHTKEVVCKTYIKQRINCVYFGGEGAKPTKRVRTEADEEEAEACADDPWKELEEIESSASKKTRKK